MIDVISSGVRCYAANASANTSPMLLTTTRVIPSMAASTKPVWGDCRGRAGLERSDCAVRRLPLIFALKNHRTSILAYQEPHKKSTIYF